MASWAFYSQVERVHLVSYDKLIKQICISGASSLLISQFQILFLLHFTAVWAVLESQVNREVGRLAEFSDQLYLEQVPSGLFKPFLKWLCNREKQWVIKHPNFNGS